MTRLSLAGRTRTEREDSRPVLSVTMELLTAPAPAWWSECECLWRYRDVILSHWFDWLATWNVNLILHNHCGPRVKRKMDWPFYRWWTRICWRPGRSWGRGRRCWPCRPACSSAGDQTLQGGTAGTLTEGRRSGEEQQTEPDIKTRWSESLWCVYVLWANFDYDARAS